MDEIVPGVYVNKHCPCYSAKLSFSQWLRPDGIHPVSLSFTKQPDWELPLLCQPDPLYKYYIVCALVVFASIFVTQESLMPR